MGTWSPGPAATTGDDIFFGDSSNEVADGGGGNDTLYGGGGEDTLNGGDGTDFLHGHGGLDYVYGDAGNDYIYLWSSTNISGGLPPAPDLVAGEIYDGGDGFDILYMREDWVFDLRNISIVSIEALWVMSSATVYIDADDLGVGFATNLAVTSNTSDIRIYVVRDTAGTTSIATWTLTSFNPDDRIGLIGSSGDDTLIGGSHHDILSGNDGADTLNAGGGNDSLDGGSGNDILDGGAGADAMSGGAGDDVYVVDSGSDTVTEQLNGGIDTVHSALAFALGANVENLTLTGAASINGFGSGDNNVLTGNDANNILYGFDGADVLDGAGGSDTLYGDTGDDTLYGGDDTDFLYGHTGLDHVYGGAGDDYIYLWSSTNISGGLPPSPDLVAGEIYDGGDGFDILYAREDWVFDLRDISIVSIEALWVMSSATVYIDADELGVGFASDLAVTSNTSDIRIYVVRDTAGTTSIAGWSLTSFNPDDRIGLIGSSGDDTLIGDHTTTSSPAMTAMMS